MRTLRGVDAKTVFTAKLPKGTRIENEGPGPLVLKVHLGGNYSVMRELKKNDWEEL